MKPTTAITVASPSAMVTTAALTVPAPRGPGCIARPVPVTTAGGAPAPVRSDTALLERRAARVGDQCRPRQSGAGGQQGCDEDHDEHADPEHREVDVEAGVGLGDAGQPDREQRGEGHRDEDGDPRRRRAHDPRLGHPEGEQVPTGPAQGAQRGVLDPLLHRLAGQDLAGDQHA